MIELALALRLGLLQRRGHQRVERRRRQTRHHLGIALHQPAIAVPGQPRIAGQADQRLDGLGVQADIQHGLHHARHRHRARPSERRPATAGAPRRIPGRSRLRAGRCPRPAPGATPASSAGSVALAPGRRQHEGRRHRQAGLRHAHQVPGLVADLLRAAFRQRRCRAEWRRDQPSITSPSTWSCRIRLACFSASAAASSLSPIAVNRCN